MDEEDYDNAHLAYINQDDYSFYQRGNSSSSFMQDRMKLKQKSELLRLHRTGSRKAEDEEEMQRSQTCKNREEFGGRKEDCPDEAGRMQDSYKYVP